MKDSEIETETETPTDVAVKIMIIDPKKFSGKGFFEFAYREYEYQKKLSTESNGHSKYFAKVYNFFKLIRGEQYGIVMELLKPRFKKGIELFSLIKANQLSNKHKLHYSLELARAISATHKMGIVHGDLKAENVAISADESEMGQLKLMDFGLSFNAGDGEGKNKIDCCREQGWGSLPYFSYELMYLAAKRGILTVGADADWWAYGIIVYEMVSGIIKYDNYPGLKRGGWWGAETLEVHEPAQVLKHWSNKWDGDLSDHSKIEPFINGLKTDTTERLLLNLAFQFFVESSHRPFLCLDKPQMEDYNGTPKGERPEALKTIVAKLEGIESS